MRPITRRRAVLGRLHAWLDRWLTRGSLDLTAGRIELAALSVEGENRKAGRYYLPTPWAVLAWVHDALPEPKSGWSFVDLGAGLGRATLSAARRSYDRVVGVEFAGELAAAARAILARAEHLKAGSVEILHLDATRYALPDGPVVVFLFDAFGPPVIETVAAAIGSSYAEAPRPIIVAYLHPVHARVFDSLAGFRRRRPAGRPALLFRLLSPYRLKLYATAEADALWR